MKTNKDYERWLDAYQWLTDEINKRNPTCQVSFEQVEKALFTLYSDTLDCFWILDLVNHDIGYEELLDTILKNMWALEEDVIEVEKSLLPAEFTYQTRGLIKHRGQQWFVHRNDPDPFPSKPHLHCYTGNIKLDISNGNLYNVKKLVGCIRRKDLEFLRKELQEMDYDLPEMKL